MKRFLSRELRHYAENPDVAWTTQTNDILEWLEERGWPLRSYDWYAVLDACRLVVNVHKHGKGRSLDELKKMYPQYLGFPEDRHRDGEERDLTHLHHEHLHLTEENFDQFVDAIKKFWVNFPSQIHLEGP